MRKALVEAVQETLQRHENEPYGMRQMNTLNDMVKENLFADTQSALAFLHECLLAGDDFSEPLEKRVINAWLEMTPEQQAGYLNDMGLYQSYVQGLIDGRVSPPR